MLLQRVYDEVLKSVAAAGGFDDPGELLNRLSREQSYGSRDAVFADVFYGFNRRQQGNAIPGNSDQQGLTFFTRPNMNLSYDNLSGLRCLTPLMSRDPNTIQRAVRSMLDPKGSTMRDEGAPRIFDNRQAFMPLLSNALVTCSGWPDTRGNVYVSSEGVLKESWMMFDTTVDINRYFELTCTFQNLLGDPITLLFQTWLRYMAAVYLGKMVPYPESIVEREIDYQTRVYRLIMDYSNSYVQKIAITIASLPLGVSDGAAYNYSREKPYTSDIDQISVPLACIGAVYNDPRSMLEFNLVGELFNPDLSRNPGKFVKIPNAEMALFNYMGYPRINLRSNALEWWVYSEDYARYTKGLIVSSTTPASTVTTTVQTADATSTLFS